MDDSIESISTKSRVAMSRSAPPLLEHPCVARVYCPRPRRAVDVIRGRRSTGTSGEPKTRDRLARASPAGAGVKSMSRPDCNPGAFLIEGHAMTPGVDESVTQWITRIRGGGDGVAQRLWERYYGALVRLARA